MSQEQTMHQNQLTTLCTHCQYTKEIIQVYYKNQRALIEQHPDPPSQVKKQLENLHQQIKSVEEFLCPFCKDAQQRNIPGDKHCQACCEWQTKKEQDENKLRTELAEWQMKYHNFRARMSLEVSAEIEGSGIFEDITNPCRPSEIEKAYEKLNMTLLPKWQEKSKEKGGETGNKENEKEQLKIMIKEVFTKATNDMQKKKEDLESLFNINNDTQSTNNNKQLQCKKMAMKGLQMLIFWEDCKYYQNVGKQLGKTTPDIVSVLADECYKQGCLMALCNPPLTLDWDKTGSDCFLPPILKQSVECVNGGNVIQQDVNTCSSTSV